MQPVQSFSDQPETLSRSYARVRDHTERLCEPLEIEDYIPQPTVDVSPPKWNIAHTTWFFEEMILKEFAPSYHVFDERFGFLFNSYYNSIGDRTARDHRGDLSRPTVRDVFAYRHHVDEAMFGLLATGVEPEVQELVLLGLNHEQQHQELLLSDLKYTLSLNPLYPAYREGFEPAEEFSPACGEMVKMTAGKYEIGFAGDGFCFDNELARHSVLLDDFAIKQDLVTNAQFADFVADGGYEDFRLWHSDGWEWLGQNRVSSPLYWQKRDDTWFHFSLGGLRELPMRAPVCHISFYEASAFAAWAGMRLPTEFEWEASSDKLDWGQRWEWTGSAYLPYPGFATADGAVGEYNGKFMINQMVLRGASAITPAGHSRRSYRNFFQPHLRWQYTGIRLAK